MTRAKRRTNEPPKTDFPLNRILQEKGITKYRFAKVSGIPHSMLVRLAKPEANPNWRTLLKIARALGLSLGDVEPERRPA